jgi:hypothetical protein
MLDNNYKSFVGKRINTKFGPALIKCATGKYGTVSYENVDGIGWVDLSSNIEVLDK